MFNDDKHMISGKAGCCLMFKRLSQSFKSCPINS